MPEHELPCVCGCHKHIIGEKTGKQLDILSKQIRIFKDVCRAYGWCGCEKVPITADKPVQLIEKSMVDPIVKAMLLTTKYFDGLPLYRFESVLSRHDIDIPRQILAQPVA